MIALKQIKIARTGYILISILFYLSGIICIMVPGIDGKAAALAGGMILIFMGIKILVQHMGILI